MSEENSVKTAIEAGMEIGEPRWADQENGSIPYLALPGDAKEVSLEHTLLHPVRKRASVKLDSVDALCDYLDDHKIGGTQVFMGLHEGYVFIVGEVDGHASGEAGLAGWRQHRAQCSLAPSEALKAWLKIDRVWASQTTFAEFLDERAGDVVTPSGAALLECAMNLEATSNVAIASAVRLSNGAVQLTYNDDVKVAGAGQFTIPLLITIAVPLFERTKSVPIEARLRYRIKDRGLWFQVLLNRLQETREAAIDKLVVDIEAATGVPVYLGRPE